MIYLPHLKSAAISSALPCSSNEHILSWNVLRSACGLGDSSLPSLWFYCVICDSLWCRQFLNPLIRLSSWLLKIIRLIM